MALVRVLLAGLVAALLSTGALAQGRVALVIGNSAYANAPALANPANDARAVAAALKEVGFTVVLGLDLDKPSFEKALRSFTRELAQADTGLLYYAGHGLQIGGQNYLVPIDAELAIERDVDFEAIRMEFVLKQMELDREGRTNIIILDACRDNPLAKNLARSMGTRSAALAQGLAEVKTGVGTFIAYSTQPGNVALDGTGANSPFAGALAKRLLEPGQSLNSISIKVRNDVLAATGGRQVPWDHSALTGDFFFRVAGVPRTDKPEIATPDASSQAMKDRLAKLEAELGQRNQTSIKAATATLMQLRQRQRQLEQENRRAQDRLFTTQNAWAKEKDTMKRMDAFKELGAIQMEMSQRSRDITDLKAEIATLEKELGPDAPKAAEAK